jgi:hypothetical protein
LKGKGNEDVEEICIQFGLPKDRCRDVIDEVSQGKAKSEYGVFMSACMKSVGGPAKERMKVCSKRWRDGRKSSKEGEK